MKAPTARVQLASMIIVAAMLGPAASQATRLVLPASRDNTLYQPVLGEVSSGIGPAMFAGATAGLKVRRALVRFDVGAVPIGAHVDGVQLVLQMTRGSEDTPRDFTLHRVVADWGEGTSNAGGEGADPGGGQGVAATTGDATWSFRFFDTDRWSTDGGDFEAAALATTQVAAEGAYTWGSTPGMVADVQAWVDGAPNFGWMIRGPEIVGLTARRFGTRESTLAGERPQLIVDFTSTAVAPSTWSGIKAMYQGGHD